MKSILSERFVCAIAIFCFLAIGGCNPEDVTNVPDVDDTSDTDLQTDPEGMLEGGQVGIAIASAGDTGLKVNAMASAFQPWNNVWINSNKGLIRFDVDNLPESLTNPLRGDVELLNPLIPGDVASRPRVVHGGSSNLLSVEWGRWEGDYSLREVADDENDQQYDAITLPLTYVYSNNATSSARINDLEERNRSYTYNLSYGTVTYVNRTAPGSNVFDIQNEFTNGSNQSVVDGSMEIRFGSGEFGLSVIESFTLTTNFSGTTDTIILGASTRTSRHRVNVDSVPITLQDCNLCFYDVPFGAINGDMDFVLIGNEAESLIGSFEVSNTLQSFYGTFIMTRISEVAR